MGIPIDSVRVETALNAWILIGAGLSVPADNALGQQVRQWTTTDSVQHRYFMSNWEGRFSPIGSGDRGPLVSPDAERFVIVTQRGDLSCDCNIQEIRVYSSGQVAAALAAGLKQVSAAHTLRMSSQTRSVREGIGLGAFKWQDNEHLVFEAAGDIHSEMGVFRLDARNGELKRLTDPRHEVAAYDLQGDQIVYQAIRRRPFSRSELGQPAHLSKYPLQPIRGGFFRGGIVSLTYVADSPIIDVGVFASDGKGGFHTISEFTPTDLAYTQVMPPKLSPDGRWAVVASPLKSGEMPAGWELFEGLNRPRAFISQRDIARLQRLAVVSMRTGAIRVLPGVLPGAMPPGRLAPVKSTMGPPIWLPDSRQAIISNVSFVSSGDQPQHRGLGFLVALDPKEASLTVLDPMIGERSKDGMAQFISSVEVMRASRKPQIHVTRAAIGTGSASKASAEKTGVVYTFADGKWEKTPDPNRTGSRTRRTTGVALPGQLRISLMEDMNTPPQAIANDGKHTATLVDVDPNILESGFATTQVIGTKLPGGYEVKSGLIVPDGQGPFPLVVQVEAFDASRFRPDGFAPTAYSAQALVAQGIAVLRMGPMWEGAASLSSTLPAGTGESGTKEAPFFNERMATALIENAVKNLSESGLIDSTKIGIVGFSGGGRYALYAATQSTIFKPSAIVVADSATYSYMHLLSAEAAFGNVNSSPVDTNTDKTNGGSFWDDDGRRNWLEYNPVFNVNRTEAAALFIYNNDQSQWSPTMAEMIGAYRINKREFDYMLVASGAHGLILPRQREASLNATLEWMAFWLQNRELAPQKTEQYWYWRELRAQKEARITGTGATTPKLNE